LREREEDIPFLLQYCLTRVRKELNKPEIEGISPEALELLRNYPWPGNIRELQSVVRQSVLKATGPVIVPDFLPANVRQEKPDHPPPRRTEAPPPNGAHEVVEHVGGNGPISTHEQAGGLGVLPPSDLKHFIEERLEAGSTDLYAESLQLMERYLLTRVLHAFGGNQSKAAETLGITRGKVRDRIAAFRITVGKSVSIEVEAAKQTI